MELRRRRPQTLEEKLLDKEEQLALIAKLKADNDKMTTVYRWTLSLLCVGVAMLHLFLAIHQLLSPFSLITHEMLEEVASSHEIKLLELAAAIGYLLTAFYIQPHIEHSFYCSLGGATGVAMIPLFGWIYRFAEMRHFPFTLAWLPFGNMALTSVCWYIKYSGDDLEGEVQNLHNYTYEYKAV